ncbi:hypothetical protein JXA32_10985 [Candidatus Sumerlaeota bacterium]|nr:hypothetical protein [Candidatus Sumerlaeota bacterium]
MSLCERIEHDSRRLEALIGALEQMEREMEALRKSVEYHKRNYFSTEEHDQIENLLFRYNGCRTELWRMLNEYREWIRGIEAPLDRARAFLIGYAASLTLYYFGGRVAQSFLRSEAVRSKLNERFFRSGIEAGSFDQLFQNLTDPANLRDLETTKEIFSEALNDRESTLSRLREEDAKSAKWMQRIFELQIRIEPLRDAILRDSSLVSPSVRNALRHNEIVKHARSMLQAGMSRLEALRALVFDRGGHLRAPLARSLEFDDAELEAMRKLLRPGDLVFTYTEGFMSNLFLPGVFKHGITYAGSPQERRAAGVTQPPDGAPEELHTRFMDALNTERLPDGRMANQVEAIAEGVILNCFDTNARKNCNRMTALRPRISDAERARFLANVFRFVGNRYDFTFNFNDGSCQSCTEVIYRSLNKLGRVNFALTPRMGRPTLSADDIIRHALPSDAQSLDFIFLAERDDSREGNRCKLHTGAQGYERLVDLMRESNGS